MPTSYLLSLSLVLVVLTVVAGAITGDPEASISPLLVERAQDFWEISGAQNRVEYNARILSTVHGLDANPLVSSVTCISPGEDEMTLRVLDVRAAEAWLPGTLLTGSSPAWNCVSKRGPASPFVNLCISHRHRHARQR